MPVRPADEKGREHRLNQAVERLYGALHLQVPSMLVACNLRIFVDHVATIVPRPRFAREWELIALALSLILLLLELAMLAADGRPSLPLLAIAVGLSPIAIWAICGVFERIPIRDVALLFAASAITAGGVGALLTTDVRLLVGSSGIGLLAAMSAGLGLTVFGPVMRRARLGRHLELALPLAGSRTMHGTIIGRIESACTIPQTQRSAEMSGLARPEARVAPACRQQLHSLGAAHLNFGWPCVAPLLGATSESSVRRWLYSASSGTSDPPELVQAAVELDELCDAVTLFEHVAVVLPAGAHDDIVVPDRDGARRRSRRTGYAGLCMKLGWQPILELMIDLAGSDDRADRLLAQHVLGLGGSERLRDFIKTMGVGRFVAAARLEPVSRDDAGELFVMGRPEHLVAFFRRPTVQTGEQERKRWLDVPAYVATAREAAAWVAAAGEALETRVR